MAAVEQTQAEYRQQLSELVLSSQNYEQALKDNTATLNSLASMVMSIMNKLESRSVVSEPKTTANNEEVPGSVPKSTCETQAQTPTARIGTSNTNPIDVVEESEVGLEREGATKQYTRLTRSKDSKLKSVTASQDNSQMAIKGRGSEKGTKKGKAVKVVGKKRAATSAGTGQPSHPGGASQEGGTDVGVETELGDGPRETAVARSGVQDSGEGGVKGGQAEDEVHVEESVGVEGGDVGVLAEVAAIVASPEKAASPSSVSKSPKPMSPSNTCGIGVEQSAPVGQVSPTSNLLRMPIGGPYNRTKLLVFNVHGTLLDTSLLTSPNPNVKIRVSKKTSTRRFVFRPWMMEFLGRCFKMFKVAFWGIKSREYMEEVLREILPVFSHLEGHKPLFTWAARDCELIDKDEDNQMWGKPLSKVWAQWPCWNGTNTVILDHHEPRVDCNPQWNVIVPPPFYVEHLQDLSDDKEYLRKNLWPALELLYSHEDLGSFWSSVNLSAMPAGVCGLQSFSRSMAVHRPCTPAPESTEQVPGGEGICELEVHIAHCAPSSKVVGD
jgi:hypothetical protein